MESPIIYNFRCP